MGGSSSKKKEKEKKEEDISQRKTAKVAMFVEHDSKPVGRTCLMRKYFNFSTDISFYDNYDAQIEEEWTIHDLCFGEYEKGEKDMFVTRVDKSPEFRSMYDEPIRFSDALFIFFNWENGLEGINYLIERIERILDDELPFPGMPHIVLIETKKDKFEDYDITPALELARKYDFGFIRTSSKTGENVKELFQYFGDWYFLGDDSKIKNFTKSGSTIKKANK